MKVVKFAKKYGKLGSRFFTTIRKTTDLEEGQHVKVQFPGGSYPAKVTYTKTMQLNDMPDSILLWDTDTINRDEALAELQEYYPKLTWLSEIVVIGFDKGY